MLRQLPPILPWVFFNCTAFYASSASPHFAVGLLQLHCFLCFVSFPPFCRGSSSTALLFMLRQLPPILPWVFFNCTACYASSASPHFAVGLLQLHCLLCFVSFPPFCRGSS